MLHRGVVMQNRIMPISSCVKKIRRWVLCERPPPYGAYLFVAKAVCAFSADCYFLILRV